MDEVVDLLAFGAVDGVQRAAFDQVDVGLLVLARLVHAGAMDKRLPLRKGRLDGAADFQIAGEELRAGFLRGFTGPSEGAHLVACDDERPRDGGAHRVLAAGQEDSHASPMAPR